MISIKNLTVKAENGEILKDINLEIKDRERVVLFGPNGSGKSTLFKVIMGLGDYHVKKGSIKVNGKSLKGKSIDERVKMGLGYIAQKSVGIKGVTIEDLIDQYDFAYEEMKNAAKQLGIDELLDRDINCTLSGGEIKRAELFTLSLLPNIYTYLLDELDSGVDLENMKRIAKYLNTAGRDKSIVVTTHTGAILKELEFDAAYVVLKGKIICRNKPEKIWKCITEKGYEACINCDNANL